MRLDRSFRAFTKEDRLRFLSDLSSAAGVHESEIVSPTFRRGCVQFTCRIDRQAARRLLDAYLAQKREDATDDAVIEFLRKWAVDDVTAECELVIVSKKRPTAEMVMVHGWTGDRNSFGELPQMIAHATGTPTYVYEYPTSAVRTSKAPSTEFLARNLDNWIRNSVVADRFGIVGHSMGGLVTRRLIVEQRWRKEPLTNHLRLAVFLASPFSGASLATIAEKFLGGAQLAELSPDNPSLATLNSHWQAWTSETVPGKCHVRSVFGTSDELVPIASAQGTDPEAVPILNATHSGIASGADHADEVCRTISRFMREAGLARTDV